MSNKVGLVAACTRLVPGTHLCLNTSRQGEPAFPVGETRDEPPSYSTCRPTIEALLHYQSLGISTNLNSLSLGGGGFPSHP